MENKKVLISGGAGFLGSYLCDYYISKGFYVVCVDNLSSGKKSNIKQHEDNSRFLFVKHNIVENFPKSVLMNKYDLIINMASPASPPLYQKLAVETLEVGSLGTKNMLDIAVRDNARFFQASTSEVYGDPEAHPQTESYRGLVNCYGPRSMYDESKRYAESLIYVYRQKYGTSTVIARFFNTYGPRMDENDGRVVTNFISQALRGEDITIYGDGSQTRSFCYVDDLISAITKLIDSSEEGPMNLGNPGEFTIKQLAEMILDMIDSKSKIKYLALPGDDPMQRKPDITLAKTRLNWEPQIKLEDGLKRTVDHFSSCN